MAFYVVFMPILGNFNWMINIFKLLNFGYIDFISILITVKIQQNEKVRITRVRGCIPHVTNPRIHHKAYIAVLTKKILLSHNDKQ